MSKLTSHPSDNSQGLNISKMSKDADSFGAVGEQDERNHSKEGSRESKRSTSPPKKQVAKRPEGTSAVALSKWPHDQANSSVVYGLEERDACHFNNDLNNDSSHLVNMASGGVSKKNACLSSQLSNLDRTSDVMANGDLQTRM